MRQCLAAPRKGAPPSAVHVCALAGVCGAALVGAPVSLRYVANAWAALLCRLAPSLATFLALFGLHLRKAEREAGLNECRNPQSDEVLHSRMHVRKDTTL